jgi:hypothetical protein
VAERPSNYGNSGWYGDMTPPRGSQVPDSEFYDQARKKREERQKGFSDALNQLHADTAKGLQAQQQQTNWMEKAVDAAVQAKIEKAKIIPSPGARKLASLGYVKTADGSLVHISLLNKRPASEPPPAFDGELPEMRMIPQEEIDALSVETDEEIKAEWRQLDQDYLDGID